MSGILDSKTRIMDIVLTGEGRQLLSQGIFDISYASFTDRDTFYDSTSISGSYDDAVDRIFFETPSSFGHDNLVIRTDDSGKLVPFDYLNTSISSDGTVIIDDIPLDTATSSGRDTLYEAVSELTGRFVKNFNRHGIIATKTLTSDTEFKTSKNSLSFSITSEKPFFIERPTTTVEGADPLFLDKRLAHFPHFKFLPPVVEISAGKKRNLGMFSDIKKFKDYTVDDLKQDVFGKSDRNPKKEYDELIITSTSDTNDIVLQFFELGQNSKPITKLETVDYGTYTTDNPKHPTRRVIFVGKLFYDKLGAATFINLFTAVID